MGSEDEYDGEEIDEYEQDEIDEVLPSDEELQNQIKKIHMWVSHQALQTNGVCLKAGPLASQNGPGFEHPIFPTGKQCWMMINDSYVYTKRDTLLMGTYIVMVLDGWGDSDGKTQVSSLLPLEANGKMYLFVQFKMVSGNLNYNRLLWWTWLYPLFSVSG